MEEQYIVSFNAMTNLVAPKWLASVWNIIYGMCRIWDGKAEKGFT